MKIYVWHNAVRMNDNVLGSIWCMIGAHAVLSSFLSFLKSWCWVSRAEQNVASWVRSECFLKNGGTILRGFGGAFVGPWATTWPLPSHTQPESTLPGFSKFTFRFFPPVLQKCPWMLGHINCPGFSTQWRETPVRMLIGTWNQEGRQTVVENEYRSSVLRKVSKILS